MIDVLEDRNISTRRGVKSLLVLKVIGDKFCPRIVQCVRANAKKKKKKKRCKYPC